MLFAIVYFLKQLVSPADRRLCIYQRTLDSS
jgi:hypothetical protein